MFFQGFQAENKSNLGTTYWNKRNHISVFIDNEYIYNIYIYIYMYINLNALHPPLHLPQHGLLCSLGRAF